MHFFYDYVGYLFLFLIFAYNMHFTNSNLIIFTNVTQYVSQIIFLQRFLRST